MSAGLVTVAFQRRTIQWEMTVFTKSGCRGLVRASITERAVLCALTVVPVLDPIKITRRTRMIALLTLEVMGSLKGRYFQK